MRVSAAPFAEHASGGPPAAAHVDASAADGVNRKPHQHHAGSAPKPRHASTLIKGIAAPSPLLIRPHPLARRDLLRLGQPDHVDRRRVTPLPARPAFQRGLQLPDRRVGRTPDRVERKAEARLAPEAFDLEPAEAAVQTLTDCRRRLRWSAIASLRTDQASASAWSACLIAALARFLASWSLIYGPLMRLPQITDHLGLLGANAEP
jgi:hypothetical protein